ncbi:hypothetical protein U9M48_027861 [Paspalum notatum var. saurae]|uniref:Uncharacterized protein n=1 Tax=Paspalum notatum var. saurae TaxID=547442 RepID=A0AAQ3TVA4_PASNO
MHEGRCHAPLPSALDFPNRCFSQPRKKKVLPKLLSQDSTLEAIGDHGAPLLLLLGQEGARGPISLPFDFHHLGAALSTPSTLGKPDFMGGMSFIGVLMAFMVTMELSCS